MLDLKTDEELLNPFSNTKIKARTGFVTKREKGFKEVVNAVMSLYEEDYKGIFDRNYKVPNARYIKRVGVAVPQSDTPILGRFDNDLGGCVFLSDGDIGISQLHPVLFERTSVNGKSITSLWNVPPLIRDRVQTQLQTVLARIAAIIAVIWVTLMTIIIFG
jgi:hypothetical protein